MNISNFCDWFTVCYVTCVLIRVILYALYSKVLNLRYYIHDILKVMTV